MNFSAICDIDPEAQNKFHEDFPEAQLFDDYRDLLKVEDIGAVIIATGTYPEAKIFVGDKNFESGPDGSLPSKGLSASLSAMGIKLMRFKTGTPARVKRESIDLSVLEVQPGEDGSLPFSTQNIHKKLNKNTKNG